MKKFIIIATLLLVGAIGFTIEYAHYGFNVKCARCKDLKNQGQAIEQQIAWRTNEYKSENGKTYAIYRCAGGHEYWAELK